MVKLGICSEVPSIEDYLSEGRGSLGRLAFCAFVNASLSDLPKFTEEIGTGYLPSPPRTSQPLGHLSAGELGGTVNYSKPPSVKPILITCAEGCKYSAALGGKFLGDSRSKQTELLPCYGK